MKIKKILYIQYTNPAAYPPLEHSSMILAKHDWRVLFLGLGSFGTDSLRFPTHPRIQVKQLAYYPGGWRQRLQYFFYCMWVVFNVFRFKPDWIYASDLFSCPPAWALQNFFGFRVLYHEHDSPVIDNKNDSIFLKLVYWFRRKLAREAAVCVLPNKRRVEAFIAELGRSEDVFCVWNCPGREEVKNTQKPADKLIIYYHGNANPSYMPLTLLDALKALPEEVSLRIVAYKVIGYKDYLGQFQDRADKLGLARRVDMRSPQPRLELMKLAAECHVGLAFNVETRNNINNLYLAGASNKAFDYMACGMALLVARIDEWKEMYVKGGYGIDCDFQNPESLAASLKWIAEHPEETKKMGEAGRNKILEEWNYEQQFEPVLRLLLNAS